MGIKIRRRGWGLGIFDGNLSRRVSMYHYIRIYLVACWKGLSRSHSPTFYFVSMVLFIPVSNPHSQSRDAVNYLTKDYPGSPKSTQARATLTRVARE